jgi:glyoxylase-like metal-dependent hydrolase (beta-lactamase superfamily II)
MTNLKQFAPNLYLTEVHLDEFDVRGAVIVGSKRALVWDSLSHPRDMQPVNEITQDKHMILVYSHADWDHIWGTVGLRYKEIVAHAHCYERFQNDVPFTLQEKKTEQPDQWNEVILVPPTMTFSGKMSLDLGDVTVELRHLPGHTLDCIVAFIPEWGVLLAGDTIETPLPVVEADSPVDEWLKELQRWEQDARVLTIIPSHGDIADRSLITRNIAYLKSLMDGTDFELPAIMQPFYHETHQKNKEHIQNLKK